MSYSSHSLRRLRRLPSLWHAASLLASGTLAMLPSMLSALDFADIGPGEKATGRRETDTALAAFDPAARYLNPFLFPVRAEMRTISKPPGLKYKDLATRQNRDDIYAMVYYPHDWVATDQRPVTVYAYGSGWNGVRRGRPQTGGGEASYWSRWGGQVVVSTHYRYGLQNSMADGVSAVRWTRQHAEELGIAVDRVTGGGGSSGGHIMLSTTVITDGPENPWDDATIPKACQYHYGQVAVPSRPKHPELSPAHQLRDGLPPYFQIIGDDDKAWGEFAYFFKEQAKSTDLPFWFFEYQGGQHGWKGPANYRAKYQVADFLLAYGAMDRLHYGYTGMQVDLGVMEHYFTGQGLAPGMTLSVDNGGSIDGTTFVDDGEPGLSIVTATSAADPQITRHSYISVGRQLWADDATTAGEWNRSDYRGKGLYISTADDAQMTFTTSLPAGEWMAYAIRWKDPFFSHSGTNVAVSGAGADATANVNLNRQKPHIHLPLTHFTTTSAGDVTLSISRGDWIGDGKSKKKPKRSLPIAVWGIAILPRYTGGQSNLPYLRGHQRHERFSVGDGEAGDSAIGP